MSLEEALAELTDGAGTRYSERVVVALFAQIERRRFRPAA
jgi:HD-GYP domain-containing protein (c-di-GMP phosphodiesterase class II)